MIEQATKLINDNQPIAAIALLTQHLAAHPADKMALTLRALTLVQMGQAKEALADVDSLISLDPEALAHALLRADILAIDGQMEHAIAAYHSILAQKPTAGNVVLRLGTLLQQAKRWDEALALYDNAIEQIADFAEAYMARGAVKHHLGNMLGAADDLRKALELKPELADSLQGSATSLDKKCR
jgi:tetratricopeptide (TPR) repeat protein